MKKQSLLFLLLILLIPFVFSLFDAEFEALKERILTLEQAAEEDKSDNNLLRKEVLDLRIKVSNLEYKGDNEQSLTEVQKYHI